MMEKTKPELLEEALVEVTQKALSPKGSKIVSVIGSCNTNNQLESCKHWIERVVSDRSEQVFYQTLITMQFGRINGPEFDA